MWDQYGVSGDWLHCCCKSGEWRISGPGVDVSVFVGLEMSSFKATCVGQESLEATLSVATYKAGLTVSGGGSYKWGKVIEAPNVRNLAGKTWGFELGISPKFARIFGGSGRENGLGTEAEQEVTHWKPTGRQAFLGGK